MTFGTSRLLSPWIKEPDHNCHIMEGKLAQKHAIDDTTASVYILGQLLNISIHLVGFELFGKQGWQACLIFSGFSVGISLPLLLLDHVVLYRLPDLAP